MAASGQLLLRGLVLPNAIIGSNQRLQPNLLRVVVDETIPMDTTCTLQSAPAGGDLVGRLLGGRGARRCRCAGKGHGMAAPETGSRAGSEAIVASIVDAADYLRNLAEALARSPIAPSELVALVFEANGRDIDVRTKPKAHPSSYPALRDMLGVIGTSCVKEGITVSQLRRITFGDRQVTVEFAGKDERSVTRSFPIEAVIRPATPPGAYGAIPGDGTASRPRDGIAGREEDRAGGKPSRI